MSHRDKLDRIIASLHGAMLDDSQWRATSVLIDEACGISGTHLVLVGGNDHGDARWLFDKAYWHGDVREDLGRDYAENYFPRDERIPRLMRLPDQQIVPVTDIYTQRELRTSPTYNEMLRRAGARDGLNIRMDGPDGLHIVWALANPTTADGWNSEQIAMIESLLPHIRQFVRVRQTLAGAAALGTPLTGLLDNMLIGVLCLDWRGMIVQANARARDILRQGEGLVDRNGFLAAQVAEDDYRLRRLLANALPRGGRPGTGGSITVARASARPRVALHLTPVELGEAGFRLRPRRGGGADRGSAGEATDRPSKRGSDSRSDRGRGPNSGSVGRRRHDARNRNLHPSCAEHRARTAQTHPHQAGHLATCRPGPHGPLSDTKQVAVSSALSTVVVQLSGTPRTASPTAPPVRQHTTCWSGWCRCCRRRRSGCRSRLFPTGSRLW